MKQFKLLLFIIVAMVLVSCDDNEVKPTVDEQTDDELTEAEIFSDFIGEYTVASVSEDGKLMTRSEFCTRSDIQLAFDLNIKESGGDLVHDVNWLCSTNSFNGKIDIVDNKETILIWGTSDSFPAHTLYIQNMDQTTMIARLKTNNTEIIITFDIN